MRKINNKGQSLVELIVAIAVIEVGIFAVWSLFLVNFNAEREAEMRIVGINLAREGVEVVKNIRDSNWLKNADNKLVDSNNPDSIWLWDRYLIAKTYVVNFDSMEPDEDLAKDALYLNANGFYTYVAEGNTPTPYKRRITLQDICCPAGVDDFQCNNANFSLGDANGSCSGKMKIGVNIVSNVTWQISGNNRRATVEDNIYNWK